MKKVLLFFCLYPFAINLTAQNLITSTQQSYTTRIYKISNEQARLIEKDGIWKVDENYFHQFIDEYSTIQGYKKKLPEGHYILANVVQGDLKLRYEVRSDFFIQIINNTRNVSILVKDSLGNLIRDAEVKIRSRKVKFDEVSQAYTCNHTSGLVTVSYKGFSQYRSLRKGYRPGRTIMHKIIYAIPVYWVWKPIYDIYALIRYRQKPWFVYAIQRAFDPYRRNHQLTGYMVFNKPEFRPGDTLKLKAFLVKKRGKPYRKKVSIEVGSHKNLFSDIKPLRSGSYSFELPLSESLDLDLDKRISVEIQNNRNREELYTEYFAYEDYELKSNTFEIRKMSDTHSKGNPYFLFMQGTDENGLNVYDGRAVLRVLPLQVLKYHAPKVIIPDTLWTKSIKLDAIGETKIQIPDSIFPQASMGYKVKVDFLNASNELIQREVTVEYMDDPFQLDLKLKNDSLQAQMLADGKSIPGTAILTTLINGKKIKKLIQLPFAELINQEAVRYTLQDTVKDLSASLVVPAEDSGLQFFAQRSAHNLYIKSENPHGILFRYYLFKEDKLAMSGSDRKIDLTLSTVSKGKYTFMYIYSWGGEIQKENISIPFFSKELKIAVNQPLRIHPGDESEIKIKVTDQKDRPVPDVDLTGYAITKKFRGYDLPSIPYLGKIYPELKEKRSFYFDDSNEDQFSGTLNFERWKKVFRLDSMEFYKFLYPGDNLYQTGIATPEGTTEISPYVIWNGSLVEPFILFIDSRPVYFSRSQLKSNYSFITSPGYHKLEFRLGVKEITLDSVYCEKGFRTITSIDYYARNKNIQTRELKRTLSDYEFRMIRNFTLAIDPSNLDFGYVMNDQSVHLMDRNDHYYYDNPIFAAPFRNENLTIQVENKFRTDFFFEPRFTYSFRKGLVKMEELDDYKMAELFGNVYDGELKPVFGKFALSRKDAEDFIHRKSEKNYWEGKYKPYYKETSRGNGRIQLSVVPREYVREDKKSIILFSQEDPNFIRIESAFVKEIHELKPGNYKLYLLFYGDKYLMVDSIPVRPDGYTWVDLSRSRIFKNDSVTFRMSGILDRKIFDPERVELSLEQDAQELKNYYNLIYRDTLSRIGMITGRVTSGDDGQPVPGVNVVIAGTTEGTITDINGYYTIYAKPGSKLIFSFIGFATQEVQVNDRSKIDVSMQIEVMMLQETVVSALGISRERRALTYSEAETLDLKKYTGFEFAEVLQGKVAGMDIGAGGVPGSEARVFIRGAASGNSGMPLFVIDGVTYNELPPDFDKMRIASLSQLEGESAVSLFGEAGKNGVIIIKTGENLLVLDNKMSESTADQAASSLRNNFSDYAFWHPDLVTDHNGVASFTVKFPDDVTNWRTIYIGMDSRKHSGYQSGEIRSYKELISTLALPAYLVEGDSVQVMGKTLNYTTDTLAVQTTFEINDASYRWHHDVIHSAIDSLYVKAEKNNHDTLDVKYYLEMESGYKDGEHRTVAILKKGMEKSEGVFYSLEGDTSVTNTSPWQGKIHLVIADNPVNVLLEEIENIRNYPYACNEQLASKIKALLALKSIDEKLGREFRYESMIRRLCKDLAKNQRSDGTWGWWPNDNTNIWISLHAIQALNQAEKAGYRKVWNDRILGMEIQRRLPALEGDGLIDALNILNVISPLQDADAELKRVEKESAKSVEDYIRFLYLKFEKGMDYNLDSLYTLGTKTVYGGIYWGNRMYSLSEGRLNLTLMCYEMFRKKDNKEVMNAIRNFLLWERSGGYWRNTYESARIIETILPEILDTTGEVAKPAEVLVNGMRFTKFPVDTLISYGNPITISRKGGGISYVSLYQTSWDEEVQRNDSLFSIETYLIQDYDTTWSLVPGALMKLRVEVDVKKEAEYTMLQVPIPAGSSYYDKSGYFGYDTHVEYFRDRICIFSKKLAVGLHEYEVTLVPRYSGRFAMNPARLEMMYFPVFYGNNELRRVEIRYDAQAGTVGGGSK